MAEATIGFDNTGQVVDAPDGSEDAAYHTPTEAEKELVAFVVDHTDRWRDYRDQNYLDNWLKYERIWRGEWASDDKHRESERSRVISPASQQAVETRHAEIMEALVGQGDFFDIKDDVGDQTGGLDVEQLKNKLKEDFAQDKIRKSLESCTLMGEIYGTLIGELVVTRKKQYFPMQVPIDQQLSAYGSGEKERTAVELVPVNPKNFIFDPNGTSIDDCMGVATEREVSIHRIAQRIAEGVYLDVDIASVYKDDSLEPTQQKKDYKDNKVRLLTYYGLVPREYLTALEGEVEELDGGRDGELEGYSDMVEAIVVIANGGTLLKYEENPYMMHDRPIILAQADTVPNRLLGRGTMEKAFNMQSAIDGSARSHMDALALTVAPMMGMDATRLPRGAKFEVKPGKNFLTNGNPSEILFPFKFGTNDGAAMDTSKEFERMLLMATGTIDSNGTPSQVARDSGMDMATATMIKKYKRTLTNIQEDFIIPLVNKAAWRYMQFDPERYPAQDVKFVPTATLGIIAREYEQKQLAFLMQTLGAQSPLTPILMQGILHNSSLSNREELLEQIKQASQPNPQAEQAQQQAMAQDAALKDAEIRKKQAEAQKLTVEAAVEPDIAKAKIIAAISTNLTNGQEERDFERRVKIADIALKEKDLSIKEKDIASNERIAHMQTVVKQKADSEYLSKVSNG